MNRILVSTVPVVAALLLNGCAVFSNENLYTPIETERDHINLAITPKYRSVAVLPFFNQTDKSTAPAYARRAFAGALYAYKSYQLQSIKETDTILARLPRSTVDLKEFKTLADNLKVDLLVFGWVLEQDHSFGLVYAKNAVRARIAIVDASTGSIVFDGTDTRSRTLVGFSMITMIDDEYMWAREVNNRYCELFRDMMPDFQDRLLK